METACFYLYVLATVFYIAYRTLNGTCCKTGEEEADMYKGLTDFISYSSINLTWFSINFVMVTMPPLSLFFLQEDKMVNSQASGSYKPLIWILWGMHLLAFAL